MKNLFVLLSLCCFVCLLSCTATKENFRETQTVGEADQSTTSNEPSALNVPLDQYLRKISGLRVTGAGPSARVEIQGISNASLRSGKNPLFILDGRNVGTNLGSVSQLVQTNQIKSVQVLKTASETSFYGVQGASGVIVIKTKK